MSVESFTVTSLRPAVALADERIRGVVERLRDRKAGLRNSIAPLLDPLEPLLARCDADLAHGLGILLDVLSERYDSIDAAVRDSEIPFAEIDSDGFVTYANAALDAIVPQAHGRAFASLFQAREKDVQQVLKRGRNGSLRVDLRCDDRLQQFRVELGPLRDERGLPGSYAMLLSQRAEELRQDAAQDGIVRTDMSGLVRFANPKAGELLGREPRSLAGMTLSALFVSVPDADSDPARRWLAATRGTTEVVQLAGTRGQPLPVRVSVMPNFDEPGRQSGLLINFSSLSEETARQKLQGLLSLRREPKDMVQDAMQTLRAVVPCDVATFGVYSEDMRHFRALVVDPPPPKSEPWATRWFDVTPDMVAWLRSDEPFTDDLGHLLSGVAPDQQDDPVVRAFMRDGLCRMLVLPIFGAGDTLVSALTLLSKDHAYDKRDLQLLRDLGLEDILRVAEGAFERERAASLRTLKDRLNAAKSAHDLARTLAQGTVECFGWEYAGVFRVDRARQQFELFEQCDASGELTVPRDYRQKLADGMLGHCYRWQKVVALPIVEDEDVEYLDSEGLKFRFVRTVGTKQRSAMTVPLRVRGSVELVLDLESTQSNAFAGPDKLAAQALADDCVQIFEGRWFEAIGSALLESIDQAAVIIDSAGSIRLVNVAAKAILGSCLEKPLRAFGAEAADKAALADPHPRDSTHLTLAVELGNGKEPGRVATLAAQRPLNDDYGHRLWLFTNLRERRREEDWRFLNQTVSDVARHTRAPLLVADGLLRGVAEMLRQPGVVERGAQLLDRAAEQLRKADLTFERLSETLVIQQTPIDPSTRFDALALLRDQVAALSAEEIGAIELEGADGTFVVAGWPDRLGFAFRSLLGALLVVRGDNRVMVEVTAEPHRRLAIRMALPTDIAPPPSVASVPRDLIVEGEQRARRMVALAPEAVASAVEQHGGRFEQPGSSAAGDAFVIDLPAAPDGAP